MKCKPLRNVSMRLVFGSVIVMIASMGCASTKYNDDRCYRSSCENRPLYWHELRE